MKRNCLLFCVFAVSVLGFGLVWMIWHRKPYRITSYNIQKQIEGKIVCVHFENDSTGFILSSISSSDFEWPDSRYLHEKKYSLCVYKTRDNGKNWTKIFEQNDVCVDYSMWSRNSLIDDSTITMCAGKKSPVFVGKFDSVMHYDFRSNTLSWEVLPLVTAKLNSPQQMWDIPADRILENFPEKYYVANMVISDQLWAAEIVEDVLKEHLYYSANEGKNWIKVRKYFPGGVDGPMCVLNKKIYLISSRVLYVIDVRE